MDYKKLSKHIVDNVGGEANIISIWNCATRLRMVLKDDKLVNKEALKSDKAILEVVQLKLNGQVQVVIGNKVSDVYKAVIAEYPALCDAKGQTGNSSVIAKVFDYISGSLTPVLPVFAASGLIKGIIALMALFNLMQGSPTLQILNAIGDAMFYFLPIMLGFSAARKLGANPYTGAIIGAVLIHPQIVGFLQGDIFSQVKTNFLGIPVFMVAYQSSLIPIMIGIAVLAPFERWLNRVVPEIIKLFTVPALCMLVIIPLILIVFGPFGMYAGKFLLALFTYLMEFSPLLFGAFLGGTWFLLVVFGLHWVLVPVMLMQWGSFGYSDFNAVAALATMAQPGLAFGLYLMTKDLPTREFLAPAIFSGLFAGVTEPIIYGVLMRRRKLFPVVAVVGAIGGAVVGWLGLSSVANNLGGVTVLPLMSFNAATTTGKAMAMGISVFVGTFLLGMLAAFIFGRPKKDECDTIGLN